MDYTDRLNATAENLMKLPADFYMVVADFGSGFGTPGEILTDIDDAADWLAEQIEDARPARVFKLDLDADTNMPESWSDVTDWAASILHERRKARGLVVDEQAEIEAAEWKRHERAVSASMARV